MEATAVMTTMTMAAAAATMVITAMKGQPNQYSTLIGYEDDDYKLG